MHYICITKINMENSSANQNIDLNKGLGIACLVLGIITVVFAFIPCLGIYAVFPGIITIILAALTISQAIKSNTPKDLAIAGLVCGIIGISIASWQWFNLKMKTNEVKEKIEKIGKVK